MGRKRPVGLVLVVLTWCGATIVDVEMVGWDRGIDVLTG